MCAVQLRIKTQKASRVRRLQVLYGERGFSNEARKKRLKQKLTKEILLVRRHNNGARQHSNYRKKTKKPRYEARLKDIKEDQRRIRELGTPTGAKRPAWDKKLAYDYASPYVDGRPATVAGQAEVREYKVVCSDGKLEIGRDSDIVSVLFGG